MNASKTLKIYIYKYIYTYGGYAELLRMLMVFKQCALSRLVLRFPLLVWPMTPRDAVTPSNRHLIFRHALNSGWVRTEHFSVENSSKRQGLGIEWTENAKKARHFVCPQASGQAPKPYYNARRSCWASSNASWSWNNNNNNNNNKITEDALYHQLRRSRYGCSAKTWKRKKMKTHHWKFWAKQT